MSAGPLGSTIVAARYRLDDRIGQGASGVVWRAQDLLLERRVAMKELVAPISIEPVERQRLQDSVWREARAAARLHHPSAVSVYDVVDEGDRQFIVMELVEAPNLKEVVAEKGPLSPEQAAGIGLDLVEVLEAAHSSGLVHRDVKPANVLVPPLGRTRLSDFGIASLIDDPSITATGILKGTPSYMAPEQALGTGATPASDMWSLGATLYFAVEGQAPFDQGQALATLTAIAMKEPRPAERAGPMAPVLAQLLSKEPSARPGYRQLRAQLRAIVGPTPALTPLSDSSWAPAAAPAPGPGWAPGSAQAEAPPQPTETVADAIPPQLPDTVADAIPPQLPATVADAIAPPRPASVADAIAPPRPATVTPAKPVSPLAPFGPAAAAPSPVTAEPHAPPETSGPSTPQETAEPPAPPAAARLPAPPVTAETPAPPVAARRPATAHVTRRRPRPATVIVGLIVIAIAAYGVVRLAGGQHTEVRAGSVTTTTGSVTARPQTAGTVAGSPNGAIPTATGAIPAGWTAYIDDATGFKVAYPATWSIVRHGTLTDFRDPRTGTYLRIDHQSPPEPTADGPWYALEKPFAAANPGYQRISITRTVFHGDQAAIWEYTYGSGGNRLHAIDLGIIAGNLGFGFNFQTSDAAWSDAQALLQSLENGFQP